MSDDADASSRAAPVAPAAASHPSSAATAATHPPANAQSSTDTTTTPPTATASESQALSPSRQTRTHTTPSKDSNSAAASAPSNSSASPRRVSLESRSATFSGSPSIGVSSATLWRNKSVSCESIRSFEATRKAQIDACQDKDRAYWRAFEREILASKDENARLQKFFALRLQADLAYADALQRIRHVVEKPAASAAAAAASTSTGTGTEPFSVLASCAKALNRLGEVQQQQAEKLTQFVTVVRRDVVLRPLDDMVATYDERSAAMLADGQRLDDLLYDAQRSVVEAFTKFDAIYRDMERDRGASGEGAKPQDLWLAEIAYSVHVHRLQQTRVEYVKGMSALFQQYKTLEVMRVSVLQTALDTYIRKQKLLYDELAGGMSEPMAAVQRMDPERDLLASVRRIPKNYTAASLTTEGAEQALFASLRSPLASPLLVRCGFLKTQASGALFRSWRDVLCAVTQDAFLHVIELKETANRSIADSSAAMLDAIALNEPSRDVACTSVCLSHCRIEILGKASVPSFELTELTQPTGLFSSMFRIETTRKFTFQCANQSDLLDWVVAAKQFIATGSSKAAAASRPMF